MEPDLTDLHMLVLGCFRYGVADLPEDVARLLGLDLRVVAIVCADLEAAGMIVPAPLQ